MSFRSDNARLRRQLAKRGLGMRPKCPVCQQEVEPRHLAPHSRACERDCASMVTWACDRALARLWSTEPVDAEHEQRMDLESDQLRAERFGAYNIIFGLNPDGSGRVSTGVPVTPGETPLD